MDLSELVFFFAFLSTAGNTISTEHYVFMYSGEALINFIKSSVVIATYY